MHYLLSNRDELPEFMVMTEAKIHDVKVAQKIDLSSLRDSILCFDKAYIDFKWLDKLADEGITYVTRAKKNMQYEFIGQLEIPDEQ